MVNSQEIETLLRQDPEIQASSVSVESHLNHLNHKHFSVKVFSSKFKGLSLIEQHRKVYQCLGTLLKEEIHALKIKTETC